MRVRIAAVVVAGLAVVLAAKANEPSPGSHASSAVPTASTASGLIAVGHVATLTESFGGFGGAAKEAEETPRRVYLREPLNRKVAHTWERLGAEVTFSFANETPLEGVIKYVKKVTAAGNEKGLSVYVDPVGLQEAEKTMTSPVQIDLEDVPLSTALELALKQLGLKFYVQKDGIVVVTSEENEDLPSEANAHLLDEVVALRKEIKDVRQILNGIGPARDPARRTELAEEVASLRREIETLRSESKSAHTRPAAEAEKKAGGGFR